MTILAFLGAAAPSILLALVLGGGAAVGVFVLLAASRKKSGWWLALVFGLVVTVVVFGGLALARSYTTVEYGTVALVKRFGGLTGTVFEPGLHWRTPFIDELVTIPTVVQSYETSDTPDQSGADYRDIPVTAQTVDGQQILIKYTVLFRIPASAAVDIAQRVGPPLEVVENVIKAHSRNLARLLAQRYTAEDLYSGDGIFAYQVAVAEELEAEFAPYGVILEDFLVRKIDFDEEYIRAIEQQQIAQEAIETARYQADAAEYERDRQIRLAEAEAQRIRLMAQADADRTLLLAQADADRQRLLADSEAYSIEARGEVLESYPQLVQWEFVSNLTGVQWGFLPTDSVTPLLPMPELGTGEVLP